MKNENITRVNIRVNNGILFLKMITAVNAVVMHTHAVYLSKDFISVCVRVRVCLHALNTECYNV